MLNLVVLALTVILLLVLLRCDCLKKNVHIQENFIDNIEGMEKTLNNLEEKEKETRMFCKILRNKESQDEIDYVLESNKIKFQNELDKQNKTINDLKKKIINLKLDKVDKEFIDFNNKKNEKDKSLEKRSRQIDYAKKILKEPKMVNLKINNNF
mgnify:CR=1 FL=1|tara:strand:+ start:563 stop:1024 length:462 start_codon:yes stop_codon:yes gene_type:complete